MTIPSPSQFMTNTPSLPNGNTLFAQEYAYELKTAILEHAAEAPRTLQRHLGPSELGSPCHREVAGKMAGLPATNHVADPWASIVGTALHLWLAACFAADNVRHGMRWVVEHKVTPHPDHPGTADLYDLWRRAVVDHKNLGESSMAKVRANPGPPRRYVVQLLLYGLGYRLLGLPVERVVLAAYPRTKSSLSTMYVWDHPLTPADDELLEVVFAQTAIRKQFADLLSIGAIDLLEIPATPTADGCYFCPFFRPELAHPGSTTTFGCPGHGSAIG